MKTKEQLLQDLKTKLGASDDKANAIFEDCAKAAPLIPLPLEEVIAEFIRIAREMGVGPIPDAMLN